MSGWLALHGGNGWLESKDTALRVLGHATSLVVIPTAAAFEGPDAAVASASEWFGQLGLAVSECRVLNRHDANDHAKADQVRQAGALLFTGGQPLHLRAVMSESAVWAAVCESFANGTPIIAEGAAASAFGDPMLDPRGGAFTIGLGLAPGLAILPGSDEWLHDRRVRTLRLAGSHPLALVPSSTTLLRDPHGSWSSAGSLAVTFVGEPQ